MSAYRTPAYIEPKPPPRVSDAELELLRRIYWLAMDAGIAVAPVPLPAQSFRAMRALNDAVAEGLRLMAASPTPVLHREVRP
jgi:hypothetical protein